MVKQPSADGYSSFLRGGSGQVPATTGTAMALFQSLGAQEIRSRFKLGGDQATATFLRKTETLRDSTSGSRFTDFKMARSALTLKTAYTSCPDGLS